MRDELRGLPGKHEILAGLFAPALHCQLGRRVVKDAVQFRGLKAGGVKFKLLLKREILGEERSPPRIIVPPRRADENVSHYVSPALNVPRPRICRFAKIADA